MAAERKAVIRCAIYTRKSSEEGLEQSFNSLDAQREACQAYIVSQRHEGWHPIATKYDDGGFSGGIAIMQIDPTKLLDFAARYTAAWCSHDPANVGAFFSPGASFTVNDGTPSVGRSEITALAQSFMTTFPDLQVIMDDMLVRGDHAEYHWTLTGTNSGPGALQECEQTSRQRKAHWQRRVPLLRHP